jgi:hypothetical protein
MIAWALFNREIRRFGGLSVLVGGDLYNNSRNKRSRVRDLGMLENNIRGESESRVTPWEIRWLQ